MTAPEPLRLTLEEALVKLATLDGWNFYRIVVNKGGGRPVTGVDANGESCELRDTRFQMFGGPGSSDHRSYPSATGHTLREAALEALEENGIAVVLRDDTAAPSWLTLEEARRRYEAASAELSQLCQGKRFRMTIPVRPDDSDTILGEALQALRALIEGHDLVPRTPAAEPAEAASEYLSALDAWNAAELEPYPGDDQYREWAKRHEEARRRLDSALRGLRAALAQHRGETS